MRAVKSEEELGSREEQSGCRPLKSLSADSISLYKGTSRSSQVMTTPAVMTANLTKFRQSTPSDKIIPKRKELYRGKMKRDGLSDQLNIGERFEAGGSESGGKEGKDGGRPSTRGSHRSHARESPNHKEAAQNSDCCKRCSTPGEGRHSDRTTGYGDEGFFEDDPKSSVIDEVKDLLSKSDKEKPSDDNQDNLISKRCLESEKPKKRIWLALLVWLMTFAGALVFYFSLFVYTYKYEPFYSRALELVGMKQEPPPPPPTVRQQLYQLVDLLRVKLYGAHLSLMHFISLPFNNKSQ